MAGALGRGKFPTTGIDAADAWVRDARGYIGIVANRCKVCVNRSRCRDCFSLQARLLTERHDAICRGDTFEDELDRMKKAVLAQFCDTGKTTIRGDELEVPGLRSAHKARFLSAMCAEGLLVLERRTSGASNHRSIYYSIPQHNNNETKQRNNG
jgi:hypothetical protein